MIKTINYFFQAIIIYFFFIVGFILRIKISRKIFSYLFSKIGPLFKSKNNINKNLNIFSENISNLEKDLITKSMWENYGMTFIEYIFLKKYRNEKNHVAIFGNKNLLIPIEENKPVIFISGHFANFELMSMEITKKKINLATIYRPLNNFFLNPFMEYLRKKSVCRNQIKKGRTGVKEAIQYINNKHSIALMVDQRVSEGERINFFNKKALTTTLPGQLALKFNLDIVPIFIERKNKSSFTMKVYEPIKPSTLKNKIEVAEKLNKVLENMIIKNPNQWIWTHNRWK